MSLTCRALLLSSSLFIGACGLFQKHNEHLSFKPKTKVFNASFLNTWKAVQKAMAEYPLKENNVDKGLIVTDIIKGPQMWHPPFQEKSYSDGYNSQITINVLKGKYRNKESTKVVVTKNVGIKRDYFAPAEKIGSDGFEENRLLYRIKRHLIIEQALDKAYANEQ